MKNIIRILSIITLFAFPSYASEPVRVGVLDTGLDLNDSRFKSVLCPKDHKDFTNTTINDLHGHGTHIAGIIKKHAEDAKFCLVILKFYENDDPKNIPKNFVRLQQALWYATVLNLHVLNLSLNGSEPYDSERHVLSLFKKTIISVAAGNEGKELREPTDEERLQTRYSELKARCTYPACYNLPNMHIVGGLHGFNKSIYSNYGEIVKYWEQMQQFSTLPNGENGTLSGTSQATAVHTGKLVKELYDKQTY